MPGIATLGTPEAKMADRSPSMIEAAMGEEVLEQVRFHDKAQVADCF